MGTPMTVAAPGAVAGPDGMLRCPWALGSPDYRAYHDEEWGRPVRSDAGIFERLSLEAFQSGLSWLTIVRNRAKISAVIRNARAAMAVPGGLAALVWRYAGPPGPAPVTLADVPAQTPASQACARELRGLGFSFVGPVTIYAAMQACGVVDDHLADCFCRGTRS